MLKWIFLISTILLIGSAIFFAGVLVERIQPSRCMKWMNKNPVQEVLKARCELIDFVDSVYVFRCDDQFVMVQSV